ncbi:MAG TPA: efflux RND transporter periplasmic adaptor subunit [Planctomycetota bacterium]|nr:efflux RND transporter periplasmic adaptor subunit [Planctomycetota bacterium]
MKTILKTLAWLIVLGTAGYFAFSAGYKRYLDKQAAAKQAPKATEATRVVAIRVTTRDLRRLASLTGTVRPMAEVRLMSKVSGRLDALRLEDGTPIEQGTVIARKGTQVAVVDHEAFAAQVKQAEATVKALEAELVRVNAKARPEELAIAEANIKAAQAAIEGAQAAVEGAKSAVAQAQASLKNAAADVERARNLFRDKVATQQQLDAAEAQFTIARERHQGAQQQVRTAEQQVRSAEQQLRAAQEQFALTEKGARQEDRDAVAAKILPAKAALELANINLEESTLEAPIAGVVAYKHLDEGNMVSPGVAIVTLMDVRTVKVVVGVAERDLALLKAGTTQATVSADAYPAETFRGTVQKISPVVDERTRTIEVEIHVPNADRRLKPGMFARVVLVLVEKKGVPVIPEHAVTWVDDQPWVTLVNNGKAHRRAVKLGLSEGPIVEAAEGVEPGALIIVRGQQGLKDADPVIVEDDKAK